MAAADGGDREALSAAALVPSALDDLARRQVLRSSFGAAASLLLGGCAAPNGPAPAAPTLGFTGVPPSTADAVTVPPGYVAEVLARWGDAVGIAGKPLPLWRDDARNSAAEQALQFGMHHDGLQFFPLPGGAARGLLVINHEYTDDGLLHADGMKTWTADKVAKAQAAQGIAVAEVQFDGGQWQVVRPSLLARRTTMATPFAIGGPAAGHVLMRTAADPTGTRILGTMANCGCGRTPWGTYLAGEENFQWAFAGGEARTADQRRWGLQATAWLRWNEHDERFDVRKHPHEFHRFGWIVELDPYDPNSTPVKRTALGRGVHEGAWVAVTRDGRAVIYSGEDARGECITKFVSRDRIAPGGARNNATLLDHGRLYVARFDAAGRGRWLPLVHGSGPLTPANGFADAGEVVIKTRQAADALGATKMDRPEWLAIDSGRREVYCALTNNARRGLAGEPAADAANPRNANTMGHIVRWQEDGDFDATTFAWSQFILAGDPAAERAEGRGNVRGDFFACPDTLTFDPHGRLWIGTDVAPAALNQGEMARIGNNQLLACDVTTGEVRRFLTGPAGCELAGVAFTPDGRTMFVNVQHPGEPPDERSDPDAPRRHSNWPDFRPQGRPRSATLAIRRRDGGVVGT